MSIQTEVKTGGPLRLPASAALVAQANAEGRGVVWDASNANLILATGDGRVDYIVDEIHDDDDTASVIPFSSERNFRIRLAASPGSLAKGKLIKVDDSGLGLFATGGAASDVNVALCEESAAGGGYALARPIPAGTVTT